MPAFLLLLLLLLLLLEQMQGWNLNALDHWVRRQLLEASIDL